MLASQDSERRQTSDRPFAEFDDRGQNVRLSSLSSGSHREYDRGASCSKESSVVLGSDQDLATLGIYRHPLNADGTLARPQRESLGDGKYIVSKEDGRGTQKTSQVGQSAEKSMMQKARKTVRRSSFKGEKEKLQEEGGVKSTFVDAAAMKEKVRQNLSKPKHTVTDYYKDAGICQLIARSNVFDKMTLFVIAFNAIWIMIDTDENDAAILLDAHVVFIIMENFFCLFFSFEWFVRFMSFKRKFDGCKDAWFVFDTVMVTMMIAETWIFNFILMFLDNEGGGGGGGNMGVMRLARLMRLSRMARMGKLLRVMPELMIMIKGMLAATRSVCFTLGLLVIIMYVFAIAFVQLSAEIPELRERHFRTVPGGIYTLVIYGIFLDSVGVLTEKLQPHPHLATLFYLFVLVGSLTVMNMLIGVLCEVVSAVAATEQEEMLVSYVHEKLSKVMAILDSDGGGTISKKEFQEILDNAEAVRCLADVGIDVFALVDLADYIFEDDDAENQVELELDFAKFMEVVLQLRGTNQATVKDIVDLRKFMRLSLLENYKQTQAVLTKLEEGASISKQLLKQYEKYEKASKIGYPDIAASNERQFSPEQQISWEAVEEGFGSDHGFEPLGDEKRVILKGSDSAIEGGPPPQLPKITPGTGQLLSFVPILVDDFSAITSSTAQDNLALSGNWSPLEDDKNRLSMQYRIPREDEASVPIESALVSPVSPRPVHQSSLAGALRKGLARDLTDAGLSTALCIGADTAKMVNNSEVEALQLHVDRVCEDLAMCLNNAIELARRSSEPGKVTSCNL